MGYVFRLWLNSNPSYISPRTRAAPARSTPLAITFISKMDTRIREYDDTARFDCLLFNLLFKRPQRHTRSEG
jgi:hypothetical protein